MTLESDSETVLPALAPRSASHVAPISVYEVCQTEAGWGIVLPLLPLLAA